VPLLVTPVARAQSPVPAGPTISVEKVALFRRKGRVGIPFSVKDIIIMTFRVILRT
jgi:hypothetical protein